MINPYADRLLLKYLKTPREYYERYCDLKFRGGEKMKHISAVLVKFVLFSFILGVILRLTTGLEGTEILMISAVVTALSYFVGDLLLLSRTNNTVATIVDAALSFVVIYLFNYWADIEWISVYDALICAAAIGVFEIFYHKFVVKKVYPDRSYNAQ